MFSSFSCKIIKNNSNNKLMNNYLTLFWSANNHGLAFARKKRVIISFCHLRKKMYFCNRNKQLTEDYSDAVRTY